MTLKDRIGKTGVKLWWYPRTEYAELSDEQKEELKKFKGSATGKKQIAINMKRQTQGGRSGNPSATQKSKENGNSTSTPFTNWQANKVAAAVTKIRAKDKKEDAKF